MLDGYSSEDFTGTDSDPTFIEGGSSDAEPSDTESFLTARTPSQPTSRRASFNEGHPAADRGYNQSFNHSGIDWFVLFFGIIAVIIHYD